MNSIEITAKDGAAISALTLGFDDKAAKAAVIICHGFGEHSGSYVEAAEKLHAAGYACIIHNQRGHGKAPDDVKEKKWFGIIPDYQSFVDDVITLTEYINENLPGVPVILYGHSMGGNIVINTLLRLPREQASKYLCAVLESPWLDLHKQPVAFLRGLLQVLSKVTPNFRIVHKMNSSDLSTVSDRADGYTKDPLYHGFLSAKMITGIFSACKYAKANAGRFPGPALLAYADDDTVVCNKAIAEFAGSAGDTVMLKKYASKHAIHNDANREAFFADIISYMDSKL